MKKIINFIDEVEKEYNAALKEYKDSCLRGEFEGQGKYVDSHNNIFSYEDSTHQILMECIDEYQRIKNRSYSRDYADASNDLENLYQRVINHRKGIAGRRNQTKGPISEKISGEKAFIDDFRRKLRLSKTLIDNCLMKIEDYITCFENDTSDICEDKDFILLRLNKCIILNETNMFAEECIGMLNKLTQKIHGRDYYSDELLFRTGTLNMSYRLYTNAEALFEQFIDGSKSRNMANEDDEYKNMLFSSYMMLASCYEYSGEYSKSLAILMGIDTSTIAETICEDIIKQFEINLANDNKRILDLSFAADDNEKKKAVIKMIKNIIGRDSFLSGCVADFAYHNGDVYTRMSELENQKIISEIDSVYNSVINSINSDGDTQFRNERLNKVENKDAIIRKHLKPKGSNKLLHDYLHIFAHCLNEVAVLVIGQKNIELYRKIIILARAIMLYVSDDDEIYAAAHSFKSCFATVYAEAGEFGIARNIITEIIHDKQYEKMDAASKAELDFFYYLIPRIDEISNSTITFSFNNSRNYDDHYLSCCYRTFDFDAIAHYALLSFEYRIAKILQVGDLADISAEFDKITNDSSIVNAYHKAIRINNLEGHNVWLKNERNKLKYMYQFLKLFLKVGENGMISYEPQLFETAYMFLSINSATGKNIDDNYIPYLKFDDIEETIIEIKRMFRVDNLDEKNILLISNLCLIISDKTIEIKYGVRNDNQQNDNQQTVQLIIHNINGSNRAITLDEDIAYFVFSPQRIANSNNLKNEYNVRFFDNVEDALRAFFLFATFCTIKNDFANPSRIFIMTPVNNAEPCKFTVFDNDKLVKNGYKKQKLTNMDSWSNFTLLNEQYSLSIQHPTFLSRDWLHRLNVVTKDWVWSLSFVLKGNQIEGKNSYIRYNVYYPNKASVSSIINNVVACKKALGKLYSRSKKPHQKICCGDIRRCRVCKKNIADNAELIGQLMHSFPEIKWEDYYAREINGRLFLWTYDNSSESVWRITYVSDCHNKEDEIMQAICKKGNDNPFADKEKYSPIDWPTPDDYSLTNAPPFVFISHIGKSDEIVKRELATFFVNNRVRYWYDHERYAGDWSDKVLSVINYTNCVGCVLLITSQDYFKSKSVNSELKALLEKKKKNDLFLVIPIVYNCYGVDDLKDTIRSAYRSTVDEGICEELLGVDNSNALIMYLNEISGSSLEEYKRHENDVGRTQGTLMFNLRNIKTIRE